jgi:SAM-dependent methyltransferase
VSNGKHLIKVVGGSLLELFVPRAAREIDSGAPSGKYLRAKRWILYARTARAKSRSDTASLQDNLFKSWRTDAADDYFNRYLDRFEKWFLGPHHEIVDQLTLLSESGRYTRLIEVGCGSGQVLEHCAAAMPGVADFVGVDINASIIARNKAAFAENPRLTFLAADASTWLRETVSPGTILLTYGGVMEYFRAETLIAMFQSLAAHAPAAVALVEPVDPDHDLQNDTASHIFGGENSFSHNHAHLLREAGFHIRFEKGVTTGQHVWRMVVATTDGSDFDKT